MSLPLDITSNCISIPPDATCISLEFERTNCCVTCINYLERTNIHRKTRKKCQRGWDEKFKGHRLVQLSNRYEKAWADINRIQTANKNKKWEDVLPNANAKKDDTELIGRKFHRASKNIGLARQSTTHAGSHHKKKKQKKDVQQTPNQRCSQIGDGASRLGIWQRLANSVKKAKVFFLRSTRKRPLTENNDQNQDGAVSELLADRLVGLSDQHNSPIQTETNQQISVVRGRQPPFLTKVRNTVTQDIPKTPTPIDITVPAKSNTVSKKLDAMFNATNDDDDKKLPAVPQDEDLFHLFKQHSHRFHYHRISSEEELKALANTHGYEKIGPWRGIINLSYKSKLEKAYHFNDNMSTCLNRKRWGGDENNGLCVRYLGALVATNPKASFQSLEFTIAIARTTMAEDLGIIRHFDMSPEEIPKSSPGETTIAKHLQRMASDCLYLLHNELSQTISSVFLNCDKATNECFIKILSWWDFVNECVRTYVLDIDRTGGSSFDCAQAIKFSTDRIQLGDNFRFAGATTDSGGGGTGKSFAKELCKLNLTLLKYLIGFCCIHTLQLTFKNPAEKALGMNGLDKRSSLQLIHAFYYLQEAVGVNLWAKLFQDAATRLGCEVIYISSNGTSIKMPAPILSRWWTVGEATRFIVSNLEIFKVLPADIIYGFKTNKILSTASDCFSLIKEKTIIADMMLIDAFCGNYLHPNFTWFQRGDEQIGNTPGFKGRLVLARYFIMHKTLEDWSENGWKVDPVMQKYSNYINDESNSFDEGTTDDEVVIDEDPEEEELLSDDDSDQVASEEAFTTVKGHLDKGVLLEDVPERNLSTRLQEVKANEFFRLSLMSLDKHYARYANELLVLALFGEAPIAKIVARFLLKKDTLVDEHDRKVYTSNFQTMKDDIEVEVDLREFANFVKRKVDVEKALKCPHISKLYEEKVIDKLSDGLDIWGGESSESLRLQRYYKIHYAALATTTHFVESTVKMGQDADNDSRSELRMSHYGITSNIKTEVNKRTKLAMIELKKIKELKGGKKYKNPDKLQARGKMKSQQLIRWVRETHEFIEERLKDPEQRAVYERIDAKLSSEDESFDSKRVDETYARFLETTEQKKAKAGGVRATKSQRRYGFDVTPLLSQEVAFGDIVKARHLHLIQSELEARKVNVTDEEKTSIKALIKLLKIDEQQRKKESDKVTHFKPISSSYNDYHPDEDDDEAVDELMLTTDEHVDSINHQQRLQQAQHPPPPAAHQTSQQPNDSHVKISSLRVRHLNALLAELQQRSIDIRPADASSIRALKKLIIQYETERIGLPKDTDHFQPLFTAIIDYK